MCALVVANYMYFYKSNKVILISQSRSSHFFSFPIFSSLSRSLATQTSFLRVEKMPSHSLSLSLSLFSSLSLSSSPPLFLSLFSSLLFFFLLFLFSSLSSSLSLSLLFSSLFLFSSLSHLSSFSIHQQHHHLLSFQNHPYANLIHLLTLITIQSLLQTLS